MIDIMKINELEHEYESPCLYALPSGADKILCESYDASELDFGDGGEW